MKSSLSNSILFNSYESARLRRPGFAPSPKGRRSFYKIRTE